MAVQIQLNLQDEPFYVVAIQHSQDALNDFFEFDLTLRHDDRDKVRAITMNQVAQLTIHDDVQNVLLKYQATVVAKSEVHFTRGQNTNDSGQQVRLTLRPMGWNTLCRQAVRMFEVGERIEDITNFSFPVVSSLDEINRLLNLAMVEEETGWAETIADAGIEKYRIDWWQNQLGFQLQETNGEFFKRLVWKLGASFFYNAQEDEHLWLVAPDLCPVPDSAITLTENEIAEFTVIDQVENRFSRWGLDLMTQVNHLSGDQDITPMNEANISAYRKEVHLTTTRPVCVGQILEYTPERRDGMPVKFICTQVRHRFDHRTGYQCDVVGLAQVGTDYFDLGVLDQPPAPYELPITATVISETDAVAGDRDKQMRFLVRFDYCLRKDGQLYSPKAWLYRTRPSSALNGSGDYHPLPTGTKVTVQMINGDREQPVITGTFLTKHRSAAQ